MKDLPHCFTSLWRNTNVFKRNSEEKSTQTKVSSLWTAMKMTKLIENVRNYSDCVSTSRSLISHGRILFGDTMTTVLEKILG